MLYCCHSGITCVAERDCGTSPQYIIESQAIYLYCRWLITNTGSRWPAYGINTCQQQS